MIRRISISFFCPLLITGLLIVSSGANLIAQESKLTAIVNEVGAPNEMTLRELKSILKGERQRWKGGSKVTVVLMKSNTTIGMLTSVKIFDMTANQVSKFFLSMVFQGKIEAPVFLNTEAEILDYVKRTKGAIGIIGPQASSVSKLLLVEGEKTF